MWRRRRRKIHDVTGTPGTGKSTLASQVCEAFTNARGDRVLRHIDVGSLVKKNAFHKSYDEEWETYEVDEDQLLDYLEPMTGGTAPDPLSEDPVGCNEAREIGDDEDTKGGLVLDWHTCDVWPERWADLVVVLRCDHQILWKRLEKRGYAEKKIAENNEAEIMGVVADDATDSYAPESIVTLASEDPEEMESNVERIVQWVHAWRQQRGLEL